jgi:hypothetical protein
MNSNETSASLVEAYTLKRATVPIQQLSFSYCYDSLRAASVC